MSTELVTAHAGQNHVDSADIGELYAGAFGSGRYALDVGERLSVGMTDANTLHIGTGGFIFDGRWVRVTGSGEDIKIANGGQGMFRKDLVAYVYSRDPSSGNIESGSWVVVQGEPASTEAAATAPAIDEGSILDGDLKAACAVAEVDIAGLTPTAKLLLPCVASLKAVGDSVSRIPRLFTGSKVLRSSDSSCILFSRDEFKKLFGSDFNQNTDVVFVMNGDGSSSQAHVDGCVYFTDSDTIYATFDRSWSGLIRVNYMVALA